MAYPIEGFREVIKQHIQQMQDAEFSYLIANSALYSKETLLACDSYHMKWITRVPETLNDAKWALKHIDVSTMIPIKEGYKYTCLHNLYANIRQRWLVIHSQAKQHREQKSSLKCGVQRQRKNPKHFRNYKKRSLHVVLMQKQRALHFHKRFGMGLLSR